jgi:hypothetical protein
LVSKGDDPVTDELEIDIRKNITEKCAANTQRKKEQAAEATPNQ